MSLTFGTDGVRGDARSDLTPKAVELLGRVGAEVLGGDNFAVGYDPRLSGPSLSEALLRGVAATGSIPMDLGMVPTPAVARWCQRQQVAGAMVSASHNPWHDNGVKYFAKGGRKIDDDAQAEIERRIAESLDQPSEFEDVSNEDVASAGIASVGVSSVGVASAGVASVGVASAGVSNAGVSSAASIGLDRWPSAGDQAGLAHISDVTQSLNGRNLNGLHIVVDCANGAASHLAPACLQELGAQTKIIHASPDGHNINQDCGSLHPESLQAAVVSSKADAGIAFDGDADRVLAVDHTGALVDGDQILAMCAIDRHNNGRLDGSAVVITVMANLGLRQAMADRSIGVVETAVGDRNVLDALDQHNLVLGGEQSGHLIFRDLATTGDGLLTAVQMLDIVKRSGQRLASLVAEAMNRMPQVLLGVPLPRPMPPESLDAVLNAATQEAEARLGPDGRVLIRPSGTEPLVRVMVEAGDEVTAQTEAERVATALAATLE